MVPDIILKQEQVNESLVAPVFVLKGEAIQKSHVEIRTLIPYLIIYTSLEVLLFPHLDVDRTMCKSHIVHISTLTADWAGIQETRSSYLFPSAFQHLPSAHAEWPDATENGASAYLLVGFWQVPCEN